MKSTHRAGTVATAILASLLMTGHMVAGDNRGTHLKELNDVLDTKENTHGDGEHMDNFQSIAETMINAMVSHAGKLGVKGVIVVASMDSSGFSWESRMKAVRAAKDVPDHPEQHEYPGYNFIGIAYSKAAEMADTKLDSGSKVRPAYQGEFGYQGGVIRKTKAGFILAVFSGATSEQDLEIANVGMSTLQSDR